MDEDGENKGCMAFVRDRREYVETDKVVLKSSFEVSRSEFYKSREQEN